LVFFYYIKLKIFFITYQHCRSLSLDAWRFESRNRLTRDNLSQLVACCLRRAQGPGGLINELRPGIYYLKTGQGLTLYPASLIPGHLKLVRASSIWMHPSRWPGISSQL